jgi:hypothetical protein
MASGEDGATEVAEQTNTGGHEPNNLSQHEKVKADDDMAASDAFDSSIPGISNAGRGLQTRDGIGSSAFCCA